MSSNSKDLSLGVERSIDDLGRLVLPKEMRDKLNFNKNQTVTIKLYKNCIQIEKSVKSCCLCEREDSLEIFKGLIICRSCLDEMVNTYNK